MNQILIYNEQIIYYLNVILKHITTYVYNIYQLSGPYLVDTDLDPWRVHSHNYFYIIMLVVIISSMNDFICRILGVVYPVLYSLQMHAVSLNDQPESNQLGAIITLNKYWILYNLLMIIDNFFWVRHKFNSRISLYQIFYDLFFD